MREGVGVTKVAPCAGGVEVTVSGETDGDLEILKGSHLLVAVGRRPVFDSLGLDHAGIKFSQSGISVDRGLRTSNKRVFAIGDVIDSYRFTHVAGYHAGVVIKNALFRVPARVHYDAVPWVSYTDPELAQVGLSEADADAQKLDVRVITQPFDDNDRAHAERATNGFIKIVVGRRGRVLGATIVGAGAGELILPWVLAVTQKLKIGAMASLICPYPTRSDVSKRAAGSYYTAALFGRRTRRLVRFLARLP